MGIKRILVLCIIVLLMLPSLAAADVASGIRVVQIDNSKMPSLTIYTDIPDAKGNAATEISPSNLAVNVGNTAAKVTSATPFDKSGDGIGYVLLVDISQSLSEKDFEQIKTGLLQWVDDMSGQDRAALMTFGTTVATVVPFTKDKDTLKAEIFKLKMTDDKTQVHRGIVQAVELATTVGEGIPPRRVILAFSDGEDDFAGGLTKQEVINQFATQRIPLYGVGYYQYPRTDAKDQALKSFGEIARISGGELFQTDNKPINEVFASIRQQVNRVYTVKATYQGESNGEVSRLRISLQAEGKTLSDGFDIRLPVVKAPEPVSFPGKMLVWPLWVKVLIGVAFVACIGGFGWYLSRQGKRRKALQAAKTESIAATSYSAQAAPAVLGKIRFTVIGNADQQYTLEVTDLLRKYIVGRSRECDLVLSNDTEVSGSHCAIWLKGIKTVISDLGSTNGTSVNGVLLNELPRTIESGDIIRIGRTEFRITVLLP